MSAGNDLSPQTASTLVLLALYYKHGLEDSLPTSIFITSLVSTSQPGASAFPSFPVDGSQLHKLMKEAYLATRPFFVFVTVSQLNLNHSVLALCASALDGSGPYVPINATWMCVQKGVCFLFLKNLFSVVLCVRRRQMCFDVSPPVLLWITVWKNN